MGFTPKAAVVPRHPDVLVDLSVQELARHSDEADKKDSANQRTTAWATLGVDGTEHLIEHKLGRLLRGWSVADWKGAQPHFDVIDSDSKHIKIRSRDRIELGGTFDTGAAGAVSSSTGYGWTAALSSTSTYTFTLATGLLTSSARLIGGQLTSDVALGDRAFRFNSFTAPTSVVFTHYDGAGAIAIVLSTVVVSLAFTGTGSKFRLQVW